MPLNDLKPTRLDEIRMTVERVRAMRPGSVEQHWRWPEHEPAGKLPPGEPEAPAPVFRPALLGNRESPLEAGRSNELSALDTSWNEGSWRNIPAWKLRRNEPLRRQIGRRFIRLSNRDCRA